ncbi:MAG: thioredoxin fold domain-containing protein [Acidiferrobacteraceae bacterium]|nr:thioredoxin fold domain-containing protein [Acidiferrobacteraceae bacterium]MBT3640883.1 thioredoxin fold domain-containing protein [Acidiferrobacteraceae bacterium]MBT3768483.1 thioredoxin fold domain-containing protein [Acidiferrobacteraceae bacterium]MBT3974018.1 thioredoxin fold domain-containing protein [Acidiferrobacteraceae bacterium]MBT4393702.1 thioredoxin fold domain-containing protein [Acidiferrobacteraceae bacterium]
MTLFAALRAVLMFGLVLVAWPAMAGEVRDPAVHFFQDSFNDLSEEAEIAQEEGKAGVLVMFETDDCPWCTRMKDTVLNQPQVQDYFRAHFRVIALNTDGDALVTGFDGVEVSETEFALRHNRVRATPTFLFFDPQGKLLTRYTGTTRDPQEFLWLGEYVVGAHFKTERFSRYKRKRREESS